MSQNEKIIKSCMCCYNKQTDAFNCDGFD